MENKEDLELQANELWSQAMIKKQMAEVTLEVAKSLIGEPKESARLKMEGVKLLKEHLDLRNKASELYKKAETLSQPKTKDQFKAIK